MQKHSSRGSVTTTTADEDLPSQRTIRRLRLTLHSGEHSTGQDGTQKDITEKQGEKAVNGTKRRKNGYVEPPSQQLTDMTNGAREKSPQHGPRMYGVVQRTGTDSQQEVMAREWSVNHLRDQMNYIREVRDSLEKVRERMYGQFGGMQRSVQKLSQDIRSANAQRHSLETEVRTRASAMDSFEQMNSSLISSNIDLQKSLLDKCTERVEARDRMKSLCSSCQQAEERLRERDRELAAAQAENQSLQLQVEASQEANSQVLKEMARKLRDQYEEQLQDERRKHRDEIEALQAQIDDYVRRLEEAEKNARIAEAKIAERDQRISEVERLLDCMGQEKGQLQLQLQLQECESRLRRLEQTDHVDAGVAKRSQKLEEEAVELRERIKHLNDMVFCQQRKVETLRAKVAQKDLFITDLLDRIAIVECESGSSSRATTQTRDVGVGCDLPLRPEAAPETEAPPRPAQWSPGRHSRMDSSILKYSPTQYSMMLQHSRAPPAYSPASPAEPPAQRGSDQRHGGVRLGTDLLAPSPQSRTVRSSGPDQSTGEFRRIENLHALHETHGDYFKDYN
ncbi:hypothetical protein AAFF_G00087500 [Aldrovandia affinis]|uniref:Myocardial zonula adherens protein n=1 Tax=Aldrovandia affinis TaxID=143900 RepID=A0AAD7RWJ8_9TELE|nr:hypothetical protein AAFF_G00087500 [Aldrovandia affinis]